MWHFKLSLTYLIDVNNNEIQVIALRSISQMNREPAKRTKRLSKTKIDMHSYGLVVIFLLLYENIYSNSQ